MTYDLRVRIKDWNIHFTFLRISLFSSSIVQCWLHELKQIIWVSFDIDVKDNNWNMLPNRFDSHSWIFTCVNHWFISCWKEWKGYMTKMQSFDSRENNLISAGFLLHYVHNVPHLSPIFSPWNKTKLLVVLPSLQFWCFMALIRYIFSI